MSSTDKTLDFIPQAEVNLSTLPLTSFQDRIPATFTSWTTYITIGNLSRKLECHSNQEVGGVPHGIDADFLIALQQVTLNHLQNGGDADAIVFVSPRELLRLAGQDDSGRHYALVDESLRRLRHTVYTASEGWYEGERKGHTSQTFNILDELTVSSVGRKGQENRTLIGLRLHRVIRDSIARGLLRHLDIAFYYSLSRPQARALYRALESKRFHNNTNRDQFTIGILE
jgi:plasmid replication initiation protein